MGFYIEIYPCSWNIHEEEEEGTRGGGAVDETRNKKLCRTDFRTDGQTEGKKKEWKINITLHHFLAPPTSFQQKGRH